MNKNISLFSLPFNLGSSDRGLSLAPIALEKAGLVEAVQSAGYKIQNQMVLKEPEIDSGSDRKDPKHWNETITYNEEVAVLVEKELKSGNVAVCLGGDHTIALGTVSAAEAAIKGDLGLIWIDTHGDFNTDKTTLTGNIHGMPFSALCGLGDSRLTGIYQKKTKVKPENALFIGANDLDPKEAQLLKDTNVKTVSLEEITLKGLMPVFTQIEQLVKRTDAIWVSFDIDVIDRTWAPGVGIPNSCGLTHREVITLASYLGKHAHPIGFDIVELDPAKDRDNMTVDLTIQIILKLLGSDMSLDYARYMSAERA